MPPLNEQRRIVEKIEALMARSRRAKEELDAIPPLLERFRQSVLAAAFRGDLTADWRAQNPDVEPADQLLERILGERRRRWEQDYLAKQKAKGKKPKNDKWKSKYKPPSAADPRELPELPETWRWAKLDELAWGAGYGTSTKCDYGGKGPPVLRIPNVVGGNIQLDDVKHALDASKVSQDGFLEPGDLLVVRTNGSRDLIGRAAVLRDALPAPHAFASYLIRLRLVPDAMPEWVATLWASPQHRHWIQGEAASSAGQYNISLSTLSTAAFPLAPLAEQHVAVARVNAMLGRLKTVAELVELATSLQADLDRCVLAKAFRGELVPQDPSDEPASVLLKRIRAQTKPRKQERRRAK